MSEKAALSKFCNDVQTVVEGLGAEEPQNNPRGSSTWRGDGTEQHSTPGRRTHATTSPERTLAGKN